MSVLERQLNSIINDPENHLKSDIDLSSVQGVYPSVSQAQQQQQAAPNDQNSVFLVPMNRTSTGNLPQFIQTNQTPHHHQPFLFDPASATKFTTSAGTFIIPASSATPTFE